MRPVAELAAHSKALRGLFSDIDDTLTHDGTVVLEAYAALVRARAAGLRIVLVTGRPAGWAQVLASMWPVDAAIAENGGIAYVKQHGRVTEVFFGPGDPVEEARRLAAISDDLLGRFTFAKRSLDSTLRVTDVAFDVGEHQKLSASEIDQLTARIRELGAHTLVSSVHAHAFFHEADKARMSAFVANMLWSESPEDVAAHYAFVGDSPNDQAAFAFFEHSIGVANVARYTDVLKPPPRYITPSANGYGFAEAVDVILANR